MELKPIKSSLIQAYSYNEKTLDLDIVFKDGVERTYHKVNPDTMSLVFDSSGSIGSKFHKLIGKGHKWSQTED